MDTTFKNDKNHLQKKSEKRTGICDSTFDKILKKFHCLSNCLFNCVFFSGLNFFFYRKQVEGWAPLAFNKRVETAKKPSTWPLA